MQELLVIHVLFLSQPQEEEIRIYPHLQRRECRELQRSDI